MTVRGDLWAVCMVCTPTCDTFPSEGRRVSSQILLTLLHSLVPLWTGRFAGLSYISSLSLGLLVVMFWCDVSHLSFLGYSWLCLGSVVTYCAPITVILPPPVYDSQSLVYLTSTLLDGIHDLLHMLPFHSPPVGLPPTFFPILTRTAMPSRFSSMHVVSYHLSAPPFSLSQSSQLFSPSVYSLLAAVHLCAVSYEITYIAYSRILRHIYPYTTIYHYRSSHWYCPL